MYDGSTLSRLKLEVSGSKEIEFSDEDAANLRYIGIATNALKKLGNTIVKEMFQKC